MITLNIEDYCQNCPEFEAEMERLYAGNDICQTNLFCAHREKCRRIQEYVSRIWKEKAQDQPWLPISKFSRNKYSWVLARCFARNDPNEELAPRVVEMGEDGRWYDFHGDLLPYDMYDIRYFIPVPKLSNIFK